MKIVSLVFKALSGFLLICSLAFSFAPPTDAERAALGPDPARMQIVQRRMAVALRDLAPDAVRARLADAGGIDPDLLDRGLDDVIAGTALPRIERASAGTAPAAPRPAPTTRETRAGGALFVSPD